MPTTTEQQQAIKRLERITKETATVREDTRPLRYIHIYNACFSASDVLVIFSTARYILSASGDMKLCLPKLNRV